MYIPEIPQNSLTDEITQIVELSKKLENEYDFEFDPPLSEVKIILWEQENNIAIPDQIKDWLRFSGYASLCSELVIIRGVGGFTAHGEFVPDDMVIIGSFIDASIAIGFSKTTGVILREDDGEITKYPTFADFLHNPIIRMLKKS